MNLALHPPRRSGSKEEEKMNKQTLRRMVGGGLFAAIIVVLQLIGGGIRFGTFSISLVLVPIVVGTAVYGWQMGGWLGLVFGAAVLLSGDANLFMTINPAGTIATVLIKGIACGLAAGGCYTALHEKHPEGVEPGQVPDGEQGGGFGARDGRGGGGGPGREHGRVPARLQAVLHGFCARNGGGCRL